MADNDSAEIEELKARVAELEAQVSAHERSNGALRIQLEWMRRGWEQYVCGTLMI